MKNHAKVGNQRGRPAFRTNAKFRIRKYLNVAKAKSSTIRRLTTGRQLPE